MLAVEGDRIVGTLLAGWDGWRGNMYRLIVEFDRRRQGLARRLVVYVEERMRSLGVGRVTSLVLAKALFTRP